MAPRMASTSLAYDPALRLYQITGAATTRFAYDGVAMIAEYDGSNAHKAASSADAMCANALHPKSRVPRSRQVMT